MATSQIRKNKNAGIYLQKLVVDKIFKFFPSLTSEDVKSAMASEHGEDVKLSDRARGILPISIECKHHKQVSLWAWWEQTVKNSGGHHPVLIIKRRGKKQTPKVVIELDYFMELVSNE